MAVVGDEKWEEWLTPLVKLFYAQEGRFFPTVDITSAWAWLSE